jgi:hypothetical protein
MGMEGRGRRERREVGEEGEGGFFIWSGLLKAQDA